ncbi:UNVERIFIED_ORG: hypothetical protein J2W66_000183 [Agrobacterium larrymoorei]|nr:hypothetical protein [Agrobacterium larrymoorei]
MFDAVEAGLPIITASPSKKARLSFPTAGFFQFLNSSMVHAKVGSGLAITTSDRTKSESVGSEPERSRHALRCDAAYFVPYMRSPASPRPGTI